MITRHHVFLTIFLLIPCTAVLQADPVLPVSLLAGAIAGTILPDIHMKRPSGTRFLTAAWLVTWTGRRIFVPPLIRFYRITTGIKVQANDKRLTHPFQV